MHSFPTKSSGDLRSAVTSAHRDTDIIQTMLRLHRQTGGDLRAIPAIVEGACMYCFRLG